NIYLAFDFFNTSARMLHWCHPGDANEETRAAIVSASMLIRLSRDIADGVTQLVLDEGEPAPKAGWMSRSAPEMRLLIDLHGGKQIDAVTLAEKVTAFWRGYLEETAVVRRGKTLPDRTVASPST